MRKFRVRTERRQEKIRNAVQARLAILVSTGAAVYACWLWLFSKDTLLEAISMARGKPYYRAGESPAQVTSAA